ncbi:MAG: hypothetical protein C4575_11225 [Desulforudis sp.]|nr:hypothetical protein [Clostridia bacterium]MDQ7791826.1 hypothetical protein [Clostridia bacterium]RJX18159.1 MAG: hypothetical protein C4575_11225 [Desulforudis sp.]
MEQISDRIVEAYTGEYASGKSEVAVNRALDLAGSGREVTLVDLDVVEPCYTLRPIKKELAALGLNVVAWETRDTVGLGEAGTILKGEARWALRRSGDIIFDIGYGVEGARTINLIEDLEEELSFVVLAVVNASRPMTATVNDIVEHVRMMGRVDGLICNTHLAEETTAEVVQEGALLVSEAARHLGLPVVATTTVTEIARRIGPTDAAGNPIRALTRYMPRTFW